jgi:adenosylcobinamide kinase/adenosylcobinamide-phosphate guanylyltransferase
MFLMNCFIGGGCKNGKTSYAQDLAVSFAEAQQVPLYYVAAMIPHDEEDRRRIARHIENRAGMGFETIEKGRRITEILKTCSTCGVFLIDSVTALLQNEMFAGEVPDLSAKRRVEDDLLKFAGMTGRAIFVSDSINCGLSEQYVEGDFTEYYCRALAQTERALARICGSVTEISYGMPVRFK